MGAYQVSHVAAGDRPCYSFGDNHVGDQAASGSVVTVTDGHQWWAFHMVAPQPPVHHLDSVLQALHTKLV